MKVNLRTTDATFETVHSYGSIVAGMPLEDGIKTRVSVTLPLASSEVIQLMLQVMQVGMAMIVRESFVRWLSMGLMRLLIRGRMSISTLLVIGLPQHLVILCKFSIASTELLGFRLDIG